MSAMPGRSQFDATSTSSSATDRKAALRAARRRARRRDEILAATGQVLGVAGASLAVEQRRDLRADGPVRLRQVDAAARRQRPQHGDARQGAASTHDGQRGRRRHLRRRRRCARCARTASPWCSSSSRCCPGARCAENVGFGLELRGMPKAERDRVVDEKLDAGRPRPTGPASTRTSSRAACSSASASPAPSPPTPTSC